jgi:hypothetical protein
MGLSDWIELLVVKYTNVCMPRFCSMRAKRCDDGQHGCAASTTTSNNALSDKVEHRLIICTWVTSSLPAHNSLCLAPAPRSIVHNCELPGVHTC